MVLLQVDQVNALFRELNELRENGWKEEAVEEVIIPLLCQPFYLLFDISGETKPNCLKATKIET